MVIMDKGVVFFIDLSFFFWGNDNDFLEVIIIGVSLDFNLIFDWIWKIWVIGMFGNVIVYMIYSNDGNSVNYGLLVDSDEDFILGVINYVFVSFSGDIIIFINVVFFDGDYFILGLIIFVFGNVDINFIFWFKVDEGLKNGGSIVILGVVDEWEEFSGNGSFIEIIVIMGGLILFSNGMNYNLVIYFDGIDDRFEKNNFDVDVLFSDEDNMIFLIFKWLNVVDVDVFCGWEDDVNVIWVVYFELVIGGMLWIDFYDDVFNIMISMSDKNYKNVIVRVYFDNLIWLMCINGL